MVTIIDLPNKTKLKLDKLKVFPRESYDDVMNILINVAQDDEEILSKKTIRDLEKSLDEGSFGNRK